MTPIGNIVFAENCATQESVWSDAERRFFSKGIDDPKFRLLKFHCPWMSIITYSDRQPVLNRTAQSEMPEVTRKSV